VLLPDESALSAEWTMAAISNRTYTKKNMEMPKGMPAQEHIAASQHRIGTHNIGCLHRNMFASITAQHCNRNPTNREMPRGMCAQPM
jgi:hypothetical protein